MKNNNSVSKALIKYIKEKDFTLQEKIEIPPQVYMDYMLNNHNKSLEEKYESLFCK